jgi:hypothetical protein
MHHGGVAAIDAWRREHMGGETGKDEYLFVLVAGLYWLARASVSPPLLSTKDHCPSVAPRGCIRAIKLRQGVGALGGAFDEDVTLLEKIRDSYTQVVGHNGGHNFDLQAYRQYICIHMYISV